MSIVNLTLPLYPHMPVGPPRRRTGRSPHRPAAGHQPSRSLAAGVAR